MSKIEKAFENGKAFIGFVTAGDPDMNTSREVILQMARGGCDLIEIGIPFSDPIAEGPVIQEADLRSLSAGTTTDQVMDLAAGISKEISTPLVFMTYLNVLFKYGYDKFLKKAKASGISGVIVPDLPYEEKEELTGVADLYDIDVISLIAPTSEGRITQIAREAEGFLYCVSSLGVTGTRSRITTDIGHMVDLAKKANPEIPCAVGFGISTPEQAREISAACDGVIVGSAVVKIIAQYGKGAVPYAAEFAAQMKHSLQR